MNEQDLRLECLRIVVSLGNVPPGYDPRPAAERLYRFVQFGAHSDEKREDGK